MKRRFPLADVWFDATECDGFRFKIIHFKDRKVKNYIRLGITVVKMVVWERFVCVGGGGGGVEIVGFMVKNCILWLRLRVAVKQNFRP